MVDGHVALLMRSAYFAGPALARVLAERGSRLVLHAPSEALLEDLSAGGARFEVISESEAPIQGPRSLDTPEGCERVLALARDAFGRLDAVSTFPSSMGDIGWARGPIMSADVAEVRGMVGYFEATFHALRAIIPVLRENGGGQILVFTSGQGLRPAANWSLYGGVRAGQHFMLRCIALEHARDNIAINALASKNAFFNDFPVGIHADGRASQVADIQTEVPLGRPGTMEELGWFAASLLDGRNRFQTGQCFGFTGGWEIG